MALNSEDLTELERAYLAVLALGLPPSRLAADPFLRLDYLTATVYALLQGEPPEAYLQDGGPACAQAFEGLLRQAVCTLAAKGAIAIDVPPAGMGFIALHSREAFHTSWENLDLDSAPHILDRFLSHRCLDAVLGHRQAHAFLMAKYAETSVVWQRLRAEGYADRPGP
ncbi:MAG: hypothetical protein ACE5IZ_01905 [Dehalococcoidia bacterium]